MLCILHCCIPCEIRHYMPCYIYCAARKQVVASARKSDRNCAVVYRKGRLRNLIRQKLYSRVQKKSFARKKKSGQMHSRTSAPQNPKVFKHFQFYLSHIQLSITVQIKASNELNLLALSYSSVYSDAFFINPPAMYLIMLF